MRLLLATAVFVSACTGTDDVCADAPDPAITVGDGFEGDFEPIAADERIYLLINGSGYYGLLAALRAIGVDPDEPRVLVQVIIDGTLVGGTNVSATTGELLDDAPNISFTGTIENAELISAPVVFLGSVPPDEFINVPATLRVEVTDQCGTTVTTERTVLPWWQF